MRDARGGDGRFDSVARACGVECDRRSDSRERFRIRMRRLMRASFDHALQDQLAAEAREFIASGSTLDFKAGLEAFFTKTPAKFQGR